MVFDSPKSKYENKINIIKLMLLNLLGIATTIIGFILLIQ
ncbi:hypothetical protein MACH08_40720 [Oceanobacillus kimchii]|uniref:Uncharacterized protein n=1 Tax=Oceanobacillus kimchii TaxID=746691 RepID=A0ABQ5TN99_9BACI|nr:hypothetical protein MACH08_40720 [Oceanobacillus kimchii]